MTHATTDNVVDVPGAGRSFPRERSRRSYRDALVEGGVAAVDTTATTITTPPCPAVALPKKKKNKNKRKKANNTTSDDEYEDISLTSQRDCGCAALKPRNYMKGDSSLGYRRSGGSASRIFCRCSGCSTALARYRAGITADDVPQCYQRRRQSEYGGAVGGRMASRESVMHAAMYVNPRRRSKWHRNSDDDWPKNSKRRFRRRTRAEARDRPAYANF